MIQVDVLQIKIKKTGKDEQSTSLILLGRAFHGVGRYIRKLAGIARFALLYMGPGTSRNDSLADRRALWRWSVWRNNDAES